MRILALDTSGSSESVAIVEAGSPLARRFELDVSSHTEHLLLALREALNSAKLELEQIDLFAVTVGPGSFTGLRIGLSTAKALAQATGRPVAPVSTLLAMAYPHLKTQASVLVAMDARLQQVYAAWYSDGEETLEPRLVSLEDLPGIGVSPQPALIGSGFVAYPQLRSSFPQGVYLGAGEVDALHVAQIGEQIYRRGQSIAGKDLKPQYLRLSEAENRLRQKNASTNLVEQKDGSQSP